MPEVTLTLSNPTEVLRGSGTEEAWSNLANCIASDNAYSTCGPFVAGDTGRYLRLNIDAPAPPLSALPTHLILRTEHSVDPDDGFEAWVVNDYIGIGDTSGILTANLADESRIPSSDTVWTYHIPTAGLSLADLNAGNLWVWYGSKALPESATAYQAANWSLSYQTVGASVNAYEFTSTGSLAWGSSSDGASTTYPGQISAQGTVTAVQTYVGAGSAPPYLIVLLAAHARAIRSGGLGIVGNADNGIGSTVSANSASVSGVNDDSSEKRIAYLVGNEARFPNPMSYQARTFEGSGTPINGSARVTGVTIQAPSATTLKLDSVSLSYTPSISDENSCNDQEEQEEDMTKYLGQNHTFAWATTQFSTGDAMDATGDVTYSVYEETTSTPILSGNMAKLDTQTGYYAATVACTSDNGFESGKTYNIHLEATVDGVSRHTNRSLAIQNDPTESAHEALQWRENRLVKSGNVLTLYNDADNAPLKTQQFSVSEQGFTRSKAVDV